MKKLPKDIVEAGELDVYDVIDIFDVFCPALQHALKKILCAGDRGSKSKYQDIDEASAALDRALELCERQRLEVQDMIVKPEHEERPRSYSEIQ